MFTSYALLEGSISLIKFTESYSRAEGDNAVLETLRCLGAKKSYLLSAMIFDLRNVTAVDLYDTDRSRLNRFESMLLNFLSIPGRDPLTHFKAVRLYSILPQDEELEAVYRERLSRLDVSGRRTNTSMLCVSLEEALEDMGLSHERVRYENILSGQFPWPVITSG
ncbi:MAG TPA: hypothetical protein EYQ14_17385 [Gammaproteobacteria bacterium]|nr:hypothetical protein [Gammaproteobacteria bacterium]